MKSKTSDIKINIITNKCNLPSLLLKADFINDLLKQDRDALIKLIGTEIVEKIEQIMKINNEMSTTEEQNI